MRRFPGRPYICGSGHGEKVPEQFIGPIKQVHIHPVSIRFLLAMLNQPHPRIRIFGQNIQLLEKGRLWWRISLSSGLVKVAQANAGETKALFRAEVRSLQKRYGDVGQFFTT